MKNKIIFIFGFIVLFSFFTKILETPKNKTNKIIEEYTNSEKSYDLLALGSSHIFCGIRTDIIEQRTNFTAYNLSHSSQKVMQSYFLLKNSIKNNRIPKYIILDLFGIVGRERNYDKMSPSVFYSTLVGLDNPTIKKEYLDLKGNENYPLHLLNIHNNWKYINLKIIKANLRKKEKVPDINYYNGYFFSSKIANTNNIIKNINDKNYSEIKYYYSITGINMNEVNYALKIKKICKKNNIKLINIMAPTINWTYEKKDYENVIKGPLSKKLSNYIDFNNKHLLEKLNINLYTDFRDNGHLNDEGAKKLTNYLINILND